MTAPEIHNDFTVIPGGARKSVLDALHRATGKTGLYDPELLYVECQLCGKPVLWESGKTTELLIAAGVDLSKLDERCMIVSAGCPICAPHTGDGYTLAVVRLAGLTPEEAMHMTRPGGTA